jgi:Spy/CpxP family protein refolding chaperone
MNSTKRFAVLFLLAVFLLAGVSASFAQGGRPGPGNRGEEGIPHSLEGINLTNDQKSEIKEISEEIMGGDMKDMRELMESGDEKEIQAYHKDMLRLEFEVWNNVLTSSQKTQVKKNIQQRGPRGGQGAANSSGSMEDQNKAMFDMFESGQWDDGLADEIAQNRAEMFAQMGQRGGPGGGGPRN